HTTEQRVTQGRQKENCCTEDAPQRPLGVVRSWRWWRQRGRARELDDGSSCDRGRRQFTGGGSNQLEELSLVKGADAGAVVTKGEREGALAFGYEQQLFRDHVGTQFEAARTQAAPAPGDAHADVA